MHARLSIFIIAFVVSLLSACDPDFQDTSQLCANVPTTAVRVGVSDFSVNAGGEYPLYLEDIILGLEPDAGESLTEEEKQARNRALSFVREKFNSYLDYTSTNGTVSAANNPIDFLEELIATSDDTRVIGAFQEAKDQMARAIASDDDFCNYTNRNIVVEDTSTGDLLFVDFNLSYNPFTRIVQQSVLATRTEDALLSATERATAPFVGFYQADPDEFVANGYSQPYLRQAIMNNANEIEIFNIDDGFDTRLGVMEFIIQNEVCNPDDEAEKPGDLEACDAGVTTRTVAKSQCAGDDSDPEDDGETNKIALNSYNVNSDYPAIKRVRVETDYPNQEVRIYLSEYIEAIENPYAADGEPDVIYDPTNCEKQAVLDELAEANPDTTTGVRLTVVEDPGYDIIYTGEGEDRTETLPTPAITYAGQLVAERQNEL